jgi:peptide/nickel transport system permease protein
MRAMLWPLERIGAAVATLFGVAVLVFAAARLLPGSYASMVLGPLSTAEERAAVTAELGLDQNIVTQFFLWLGSALGGDFGTSFVSRVPVAEEIASRLPVTVGIAGITIVLTIAIGVPLGFLLARRASGRGSAFGRLFSALGISVPEFVLASAIVFLFSRFALGVSVGGYVPFDADPMRSLGSLLLPSIVLAVFCVTATARVARDAVLAVTVEPHITAAVARGETRGFITRHHLLRNAALPILTITSTLMATMLGGTVIVETIFDVPGVGSYLVQALDRRDYLVIQAAVLLAASAFIITNLIVDMVSGLVDPRVRARIVTGAK